MLNGMQYCIEHSPLALVAPGWHRRVMAHPADDADHGVRETGSAPDEPTKEKTWIRKPN
jgi:hypothetical protein